ncbi:helix-turn-helix transcriptional regulator [Enterococcus sp. OL5]|uniref:helix-turn-helix transcriptional regulator n=1 Tax=Enterococcus sp. OL5 TaxID=2590214 RepID=UPI001CB98674|nr:helix-turn-helix transcriptional regulator [Enterococcus sp. OL5]
MTDSFKINPLQFIPGEETFDQEYSVQKQYTTLVFENRENQQAHNSYQQELREMQSIENGDLEQLEACWLDLQPTAYGKLANNKIRNIKNHCLIVVAFASRAAIRGGLAPEIAYSLCDSYIQQIEDCDESIVLVQLAHRAEQQFTKFVADLIPASTKEISQKARAHIDACKQYVFIHLQGKLTVRQIAAALELNPNYLSSIFKQHEGQRLSQFILVEKIKVAQKMLIYSDYSFGEIAHFLGFASQSHLGTHFKTYTHQTLGDYRAFYQTKQKNDE